MVPPSAKLASWLRVLGACGASARVRPPKSAGLLTTLTSSRSGRLQGGAHPTSLAARPTVESSASSSFAKIR